MRFSRLLLGLSLAANLALAYLWYAQPKGSMIDVPTAAPEPPLASVEAAPVAPVAAAANGAFAPEMAQALPAFFRQLTDGDFGVEIARLRASGLPEETVSLLGQIIMTEKFKKSYKAFEERGMSPDMLWGGMSALTDAQREARREMREIQKKIQQESREAGLDLDWFSSLGGEVPGLSADKAKLAARIEQDREELRTEIQMDASGIMLDRDIERLKYIDEEFQKDLAAVLSPEELEAWNLHRSETALRLRGQLAYMAPTEEEFKQLHRLQETFNKSWPSDFSGPNTDWQKRSEAEEAMKEQIAEVLGMERYAEYQKATDYEFAALSNLEYRLALPKGTAERVYDLRKETEAAAAKIRSNTSLTTEDREESLKVLAEQVRTDMVGALSEEGFKVYQNQHGHWIDSLAQ